MVKKMMDVNPHRIILQVLVQPRSSCNKWGGVVNGERIQLKVTSPPVEGAANKACIKFIAKELGTAKSYVKIIKGEKSRHKTICIEKYDSKRVQEVMKKITSN